MDYEVMTYMTVKEIEQEIAELETQIQELKNIQDKLLKLTPAQRLATLLHKKHCHMNHMDQCDWEYDKGDWTIFSRKEYLKKACNLFDIVKEPGEEDSTYLPLLEKIVRALL